MNVFRLSNDPKTCAEYHCDKHVNKMLVEGVQILHTVLYLKGYEGKLEYRPMNINHPIVNWCGESFKNFLFVHQLCYHLHDEWKFRYNHEETKIHKSIAVLNKIEVPLLAPLFYEIYRETPQPKVMPEYITEEHKDVVEAYRAYYKLEKSEFAEWERGRKVPDWFNEEMVTI